jgi:hypothetical protein
MQEAGVTVPPGVIQASGVGGGSFTPLYGGPLYCLCEQPERAGDHFIRCDGCDEWFHPKCVGLENEAADQMENWACPRCRADPRRALASPRPFAVGVKRPRLGSPSDQAEYSSAL